jgi:hypothetical protein
MHASVLLAETSDADGQMLDNRSCRLAMHRISIRQRILQARHHAVGVVLGDLADVFEEEGKCLKAAVADVQVGRPVLVQDGRDTCEGTVRKSASI